MGTFKFRKCLYIVRCSCPIQTIEIIVRNNLASLVHLHRHNQPPLFIPDDVSQISFVIIWLLRELCPFHFSSPSYVRVKATFQNRGISDKIIRCFSASVPYKAFAHVCRWALNLLLLTNICDKLYENYSNPAKKSNSVCLQN